MYNNNGNGVQYTVPMVPAGAGYGYGGYGGMDCFGGSGGYWLMFLLFMMCGWGNGGMMGGMNGLYPWMNQANQTNDGFRDQFLNNQLNAIHQNQNNNAMDALRTDYQGQINALQRSFDAQTANTAALNGIQGQIATGGCETRAAIADVKYTIASEAAETRANSNANKQAVLDKLCQLELDNVKAQREADLREIGRLNSELMYARGQASRIDQTAQIRASQATVANQLVQELRSCPIPSQPVYGNQPIFTCPVNVANGNGCGCNGGFNGFNG